MFIVTRPEHPESESKHQLFKWYADDENARECWQIPDLLDIPGSNQVYQEEVQKVEHQEDRPTDPDLLFQVRPAPQGCHSTKEHRATPHIDRIPPCKEENGEEDKRGEERPEVESMSPMMLFDGTHLFMFDFEQQVIHYNSQPTYREAEDEAFNIETCSSRQVEQGGGIPILWDEERFS